MATIQLTVLVDTKASVQHTSGKEQLLEDILVLHLDGGKDFFISVSGNYLQSCFGSSLETLVNLHTYIREVAVGDLLDMVGGEEGGREGWRDWDGGKEGGREGGREGGWK